MPDEVILVCARADALWTVAGSGFDFKCDKCGRRVMTAPSGRNYVKDHPLTGILCVDCWRRAGAPAMSKPLCGWDDVLRELKTCIPNDWRERN